MDKMKVLDAYYRGLLTIGECAQILGLDQSQVSEVIDSTVTDQDTTSVHMEQA